MKKANLGVLFACFATMLTACPGVDTNSYVTGIKLQAEDCIATDPNYNVELVVEGSSTVSYIPTYSIPETAAVTTYTVTSSDTKVVSVSKVSGKFQATLSAKKAGTAEVYVTCQGKGGDTITSNKLKIKVNDVTYKTNADFQKASTTYTDASGNEQPLYMNTLYKNQKSPHLDSLKEQRVMVVPFGFKDASLQDVQSAENISRINTTFFGDKEELAAKNAQMSLAEFYKESSYGKATFGGNVLPTWCVYNGTISQFETASGGNLGIYATQYARNWYNTEYAKENHGSLGADAEPLSYYDSDNDGYIDLMWIVYSAPTVDNNSWWAYVTYTSNSPSVGNPTVKTLGFASVDWLGKACNGYDFHTYTHETGHTFGLDDYYDYSHSWTPMGGIDFMDHNLGDHNMFSKFSLGWTSPLVVDDTAVITLRPGTTTGDCFIIPSPGYNNTAFDEYMMFELMAPVGLCKEDYINGYENTTGYTKPGIRITHVDARVYSTNHDTYCVNDPENGVDFRVCNTRGGRISTRVDSDFWQFEDGSKSYMTLLSLMESNIDEKQNWTTIGTYNANNSTLFKKGASFNLKNEAGSWAETFMPSKSNLWNKAKTITGWNSSYTTQKVSIDETCTFNYTVRVQDIKEDPEYGWVATVKVTKNAY